MILKIFNYLKRRAVEKRGIRRLFTEITTLLRQGGVERLFSEMKAISHRPNLPKTTEKAYLEWIEKYDFNLERDAQALRSKLSQYTHLPHFQIIVLDQHGSNGFPNALQNSLENQIYDGFTVEAETIDFTDLAARDRAPSTANDYLLFVKGSDRLAPNALAEISLAVLSQDRPELLYADHDYVSKDGHRGDVYFKPAWNEALFHSTNYVNGAFVIRGDVFEACLPKLTAERPLSVVLFELFLRAYQSAASQPFHLSKVLFHMYDEGGELDIDEEGRAEILNRWFQQHKEDTKAYPGVLNTIVLKHPLPEPPKVSVIIPTRDRAKLVEQVLTGLFEGTDYPNIEVIVIDNDSVRKETFEVFDRYAQDERFQVLSHPGRFNFSAMINAGVAVAKGDVLCLLNNDIQIEAPDWLMDMTGWALQPDVGAVGAKLLYPDRSIQHAGVVLGMRGVAGHAFKFFNEDEAGYHKRLQAAQEYSAVTAACMVVRKDLYEKVRGFDAENLPVTFNDVDFCLKLGQAGFRTIYMPTACLIHHESVSRGKDISIHAQTRAKKERDFFAEKWEVIITNDPCFSPNLSTEVESFHPKD